jgi:hypothetical protein
MIGDFQNFSISQKRPMNVVTEDKFSISSFSVTVKTTYRIKCQYEEGRQEVLGPHVAAHAVWLCCRWEASLIPLFAQRVCSTMTVLSLSLCKANALREKNHFWRYSSTVINRRFFYLYLQELVLVMLLSLVHTSFPLCYL